MTIDKTKDGRRKQTVFNAPCRQFCAWEERLCFPTYHTYIKFFFRDVRIRNLSTCKLAYLATFHIYYDDSCQYCKTSNKLNCSLIDIFWWGIGKYQFLFFNQIQSRKHIYSVYTIDIHFGIFLQSMWEFPTHAQVMVNVWWKIKSILDFWSSISFKITNYPNFTGKSCKKSIIN